MCTRGRENNQKEGRGERGPSTPSKSPDVHPTSALLARDGLPRSCTPCVVRGAAQRGPAKRGGGAGLGKPRTRACALPAAGAFAFRFLLRATASRCRLVSPKARGAAVPSSRLLPRRRAAARRPHGAAPLAASTERPRRVLKPGQAAAGRDSWTFKNVCESDPPPSH